jgi:hypothetical protein
MSTSWPNARISGADWLPRSIETAQDELERGAREGAIADPGVMPVRVRAPTSSAVFGSARIQERMCAMTANGTSCELPTTKAFTP